MEDMIETEAQDEGEEPRRPVTLLELGYYRLGIPEEQQGSLTGADFERAGLPIFGGCEVCGASVAAYNACPSKTGNIRCVHGCIDDLGWYDLDEANRALFEGVPVQHDFGNTVERDSWLQQRFPTRTVTTIPGFYGVPGTNVWIAVRQLRVSITRGGMVRVADLL